MAGKGCIWVDLYVALALYGTGDFMEPLTK